MNRVDVRGLSQNEIDLGKNPFLEGLDDEALELVANAEALVPVLAERAEEVDRTGHVSPDTFKKLVDAGFIRMYVPKRLGGGEQSLQCSMAVCATLGRGCGSTAWMTGIVAGTSMMISLFGERAQQDVWGGNPDIGGCASQTKPESVVRVDGGFRITGRWSYLSGVEHAGWAMLAMPDMSVSPPEVFYGLVPVADGTIEQTWNVVGMRGTASNTLRLENYFVPEHRVLSVTKALKGEPATEHRNERLSGVTYGPAVEIGLLAAPIGLTQTALEYVLGLASKRSVTYSTHPSQSVSGGFQMKIAEAATKFNAARTLVVDLIRETDQAAARHVQINYVNCTRIRASLGLATELLRDAMQILTHAHGTSTFSQANPLQRMWRDVNASTSHGMVTDMFGYELYGKALVGSDERLAPLV